MAQIFEVQFLILGVVKAKKDCDPLMAQWIGMEALENKNHASLTLSDSLGEISSLESASQGWPCAQCVIFQLSCLPIEPLGGLHDI